MVNGELKNALSPASRALGSKLVCAIPGWRRSSAYPGLFVLNAVGVLDDQKSKRTPSLICRGRIVRVGTRNESMKACLLAADEVGPNALKSMNSLPKLNTVLFKMLSNSTTGRKRRRSVNLNSRVTFKSKTN